MHELEAVFQKLDTGHKASRPPDPQNQSFRAGYCEKRANWHPWLWAYFMIGLALAAYVGIAFAAGWL